MAVRLLEIEERRIGDVVILELTGQLVAESEALAFRDHVDGLARGGSTKIVVDLRHVSYIDSGGVGALVGKYVSIRRRGGDLKLLCPSDRACRVLRITGLLTVFQSFDSEAAALASFA